MRTKYFNCEVLALVLLTIIPWPGPTVFKISCPRDSTAIVRKVIQKKWTPVLDRFHVTLPLECPFHPKRDIFAPQQAAKRQHRPSLWTCNFCGKSFYEEKFLDSHFDNRHKSEINMAEDAVCLAEYCDIMRCEVLATQALSSKFLNDNGRDRTDVEIWREATAYRTALTLPGPRALAKVTTGPGVRRSATTPLQFCTREQTEEPKEKKGNPSDGETNATTDTCDDNDMVDSAVPPSDKKHQRLSEMQKLKANCKPENLRIIREHCEVVVQDCIAGLLMNLTDQDFKEVEEELNRAICWYLTCDRYWEDTIGDVRPFPWGLVFVLVMVLSLGLCLVYYVIWVLFDSEDGQRSHEGSNRTSPHAESQLGPTGDPTKNEHYIYVSYPPDLKRRLLESCYNRTTRL